MAYITLPQPELPGIRGLMAFNPRLAAPLNQLAEYLLRSDEGLSKGERELIGTYVSSLNNCRFCQTIHGAVAAYYFDEDLVLKVKENYEQTTLSDRMKALLGIAANVQRGGKMVTEEQVAKAKALGVTDNELHDTVLIAAAFCMFNRYVDGLGTHTPDDPAMFKERARRIAEETGYMMSVPQQAFD